MNLKTKISAGIATGALIAGLVMPAGAFADNTVTIQGNGAHSENKVKIKSKKKVRIRQTNKTHVVNLVGIFQNTGGNTANQNTNGDVDLDTGNTTANVTNNTTTGGNEANVDLCGCEDPENTVEIKNNGAHSENKVKIINTSKTSIGQSNHTFVLNGVEIDQNTGDNEANKNTGGTVDVDTGNTTATVSNNTTTGGNTLNP